MVDLDKHDRTLLRHLQQDASLSLEKLASIAGLSKTAAWNRIQKLTASGVLKRQVAIVDAAKIGLPEIFFVAIKTNQHQQQWLTRFNAVIQRYPEIVEAHRLAGDMDYLIKVQVASTREFDALYKRLVADIDLYSVTSSLSMEVLKHETALPV